MSKPNAQGRNSLVHSSASGSSGPSLKTEASGPSTEEQKEPTARQKLVERLRKMRSEKTLDVSEEPSGTTKYAKFLSLMQGVPTSKSDTPEAKYWQIRDKEGIIVIPEGLDGDVDNAIVHAIKMMAERIGLKIQGAGKKPTALQETTDTVAKFFVGYVRELMSDAKFGRPPLVKDKAAQTPNHQGLVACRLRKTQFACEKYGLSTDMWREIYPKEYLDPEITWAGKVRELKSRKVIDSFVAYISHEPVFRDATIAFFSEMVRLVLQVRQDEILAACNWVAIWPSFDELLGRCARIKTVTITESTGGPRSKTTTTRKERKKANDPPPWRVCGVRRCEVEALKEYFENQLSTNRIRAEYESCDFTDLQTAKDLMRDAKEAICTNVKRRAENSLLWRAKTAKRRAFAPGSLTDKLKEVAAMLKGNAYLNDTPYPGERDDAVWGVDVILPDYYSWIVRDNDISTEFRVSKGDAMMDPERIRAHYKASYDLLVAYKAGIKAEKEAKDSAVAPKRATVKKTAKPSTSSSDS